MKITILYFEPIDNAEPKIGYIDFKIDYQNDKWEIFRKCIYFRKGDKKWISFGAIKRYDKFLPRYERSPNFSKISPNIIKEIEKYIEENPNKTLNSASIFSN